MKIELDSVMNTITIDGLIISLDALSAIANPDPGILYRMVRKDGVVTISVIEPSGSGEVKPFCNSIFHEMSCQLQQDHTLCHMGMINGVRIYWTDGLQQCEADIMRDGTPADERRSA